MKHHRLVNTVQVGKNDAMSGALEARAEEHLAVQPWEEDVADDQRWCAPHAVCQHMGICHHLYISKAWLELRHGGLSGPKNMAGLTCVSRALGSRTCTSR